MSYIVNVKHVYIDCLASWYKKSKLFPLAQIVMSTQPMIDIAPIIFLSHCESLVFTYELWFLYYRSVFKRCQCFRAAYCPHLEELVHNSSSSIWGLVKIHYSDFCFVCSQVEENRRTHKDGLALERTCVGPHQNLCISR
jgi:hypothetical protein